MRDFYFCCCFHTFLLMFRSIGTRVYLLLKCAWVSVMHSFTIVYFKLLTLIQICTLIDCYGVSHLKYENSSSLAVQSSCKTFEVSLLHMSS